MPTDRNRAVAAVELQPERLCWRCDVHDLDLNSALEWPPPEGTIGQDRGVGALALGLTLDKDGFNVYVAGPSGTGRTTTVKTLVGREAASRPSASDWCYVHRFDSPSQPIAIRLASGRGPELGRNLDDLIAGCRREIPRVFEAEQYQQRRADILQQLQNQREELLAQVRGLAARLGFAVEIGPTGLATAPLLEPGKPLTSEAFELLPDPKKVTGAGSRGGGFRRRASARRTAHQIRRCSGSPRAPGEYPDQPRRAPR